MDGCSELVFGVFYVLLVLVLHIIVDILWFVVVLRFVRHFLFKIKYWGCFNWLLVLINVCLGFSGGVIFLSIISLSVECICVVESLWVTEGGDVFVSFVFMLGYIIC